ncbi:hypothetical protein E2C01_072928 [Portunus trituberculatus]|uniref:Uncharacterized protein n=1 Tax=Portunus trituberculatus TaxID=210409 RepID=A0A5B7I3V8_PORTR|nr:hypothetical protein [Portunus trituberculatus]
MSSSARCNFRSQSSTSTRDRGTGMY